MPFVKGQPKIGGRKKGSKNVISRASVNEKLAALQLDPIIGMARIAEGDLECAACKGAGKTAFQPRRGQGKLAERVCESCYGSGMEKITPDLRAKMYAELAKYLYPQLRAVEHSGQIGLGVVDLTEILIRRRDALAKQKQLAGSPDESSGAQATATAAEAG